MKIWYILGILLASAILSSAQENNAGKVVYEQVVKLEIKLEGDAAQYADMLPKERKTNKVLYFNPEESLYENGKSDAPDPMQMQHGGSNVMIKVEEPDNKVYTALSDAKQIEQREFMSRVFLIERKTENQWKLTGKQKMILEYPCQEAVMEKDSSRIVAWFTPVIQSQAGPGSYNGLRRSASKKWASRHHLAPAGTFETNGSSRMVVTMGRWSLALSKSREE